MKIFSRINNYFTLAGFYKGIFSFKDIAIASLNMCFRGMSYFPVSMDILVTRECNQACRMCWASSRQGKNTNGSGDILSFTDLETFFAEVSRYRPVIHFGGGEPFLRKDMLAIIESVKKTGMKCLVTTNGTLLNGDNIEKLIEKGIDGIIVSIYGKKKEHDNITCCEGSFDKAVEAVRTIKKKKNKAQKLFLSTVIMPEAPGNLVAVAELADKAGVDGLKVEHLNFITEKEKEDMKKNDLFGKTNVFVSGDLYSEEKAQEIYRVIRKIKKKYGNFIMVKPGLTRREIISWYSSSEVERGPCYFTRHSAVIDYNGDVILCQFFPGVIHGNIKKDGFLKIWERASSQSVKIDPVMNPVCGRCCKR